MAVTIIQTGYRPTPLQEGDDRFVELAAELGREFAPRAAQHDRDNTFPAENYTQMREAGYLRLGVPEELGGLGATLRQMCYAQAELAKHCASTALAVNMHLYLTAMQSYVRRNGAASADGMLRRVSGEGIVLMTSGASDGIWPSGTAVKVDGGYRVTARKAFCSQAPIADVLTTVAVYDDPQDGPVVLAMGIPVAGEGVRILDTWDTLGMRATSSEEVQLDDVFVPEARISGRRPLGHIDPSLRAALVHFSPLVASVYFGVAAGARDEALRIIERRKSGDRQLPCLDPSIQRQAGLMDFALRQAWWGLLGALTELGDDYTADEQAVNLVQVAKRGVVLSAIEVVDLAMTVAGGGSYFRRSPLERAYRDVRAAAYHPFSPEKALIYAGRLSLGLSVDQIW